MKIALLGYGKMGHEIEKIALGQGHTIMLTIDNEKDWIEKGVQLKECDVAIEFSAPHVAVGNITRCFDAGIPVVTGTTGWYEQLGQVTDLCNKSNSSLFYSSNFSIGVNIFFDISRRLASLLEAYPIYMPDITEIHHTQKLDSPSGTAITLANGIIETNSRFKNYTLDTPGHDEIPILSIREGTVTGTHSVSWHSEIDQITITHEAKNRRGFVLGALMAAAWIQGKKGVFTMKDMLNQ